MTKLTSQVDLDIIGIDQSCQGRGVGKRLMEWGVRNADKERVEIFLQGTQGAQDFYQQVRIDLNLVNRSHGFKGTSLRLGEKSNMASRRLARSKCLIIRLMARTSM